jgi:uncharacterized protein (TIGR02687 family)
MSKIKESLNKLFQEHRVIFWHDEEEKMRPQYEELIMDGIVKQEVKDNEFWIKHQIIQGKADQKFLLYFPDGAPADEDNWLLDLQLAYRPFHTDQEAMILQELELDYRYKDLISSHIAFFDNKDRSQSLKELISDGEPEKEIQFKMMSIVFSSEYPTIEAFIPKYAQAFVDDNTKIDRELSRYNLDEVLWKEISRKFDYYSDTPSIYDFLIEVFSRNFSLTNNNRSVKETKILLSLWKDAISNQLSFRDVSNRIAEDGGIEVLLNSANLADVIQEDLYRKIDYKIIHDLSNLIMDDQVDVNLILSSIKSRKNKYWYVSDFQNYYLALEHANNMTQLVEKIKEISITSFQDTIKFYKDELHLIDYHYRKFIFHYRLTSNDKILYPLYEQINKLYSNEWLMSVGDKWQHLLDGMDGWPTKSMDSQQSFFKSHVKKYTTKPQRLFVIISDGLRYENGYQLYQDIQAENRFEAELDYMVTGLPSYTQLGMASLLPHKQLNIISKNCTVSADGMSTLGIQGRSKVLHKNSGVRATAILATDFMKMNSSTEGRSFVKQYDLIYIYHNRIDKTGHTTTSEDKIFDAVEEEVKYITQDLLKKIANVNGNNIFITADHGYIYQDTVLDESEFSNVEMDKEVWKKDRRFILGSNLSENPAMKKFEGIKLGLTSDVDVMITKSINRLRVSASTSRFVHGGASLQEIVIPLIKVSKKREDTTAQVEIDIIKSTDKITTNILPVSFLQKELVDEKTHARTIRSYLQAEDGTIISDYFNYTFDVSEGSERQREVKHRFMLTTLASGKYKNQRVYLVLEEPIENSNKWKEYETYSYTLNISFMNDFD